MDENKTFYLPLYSRCVGEMVGGDWRVVEINNTRNRDPRKDITSRHLSREAASITALAKGAFCLIIEIYLGQGSKRQKADKRTNE